MRDGHNGYLAVAGHCAAREAVAADYTARVFRRLADRVLITTGTSEAIDLALNALVDEGDEVLVPLPTYPLYTAVIAKIGAEARYYRTDPKRNWLPDLDHLRSLVTPRTRVLVIDRSEQPDRRGVSTVCPPRDCSTSRKSTASRFWPTRCTASSASTVRCRCSARSIAMRRSFPCRACRRRTSRPDGGRAGCRARGDAAS